jgi:hypothetical protein
MSGSGPHERHGVGAVAAPDVPPWRDRAVVALVYAVAWGALLVNRGLYWDDWTLVGLSADQLTAAFAELGLPWLGPVYAVLMATPLPGLFGHAIIFAAYLTSTLLFHSILCAIPGVRRMDALVAAATFAVLPVNYARVALIDLTYALSLAAFLAATWLLVRFVAHGSVVARVGALVLFLYSFTTASLLVLYVVPLLAYAAVVKRTTGMSLARIAFRHADFLVLPVAFWALRSVFLVPRGLYEGYNTLSLAGIVNVPRLMLDIPGQVIVDPLVRAADAAGLVGLAAGIALGGWLLWRARADEERDGVPTLALALAGVVVLGLGVFAYLAVGRIPTLEDWSSRHQLLVPLGVGLLAAAVSRGVGAAGPPGRAIGVLAVGVVLGMSAVADARTLLAYQADWFKQVALIEWARDLPDLRAARHIQVIDEARSLDALRRTYRFYEYNALLSVALGDTTRLASRPGNEPSEARLSAFIERPGYHMGGYVPSPVDAELRITKGDLTARTVDLLRLVVAEATASASFESEVKRLIEVHLTPLTGG